VVGEGGALASATEESKGEKGMSCRVGVSRSTRGELAVPRQGTSTDSRSAAFSATKPLHVATPLIPGDYLSPR